MVVFWTPATDVVCTILSFMFAHPLPLETGAAVPHAATSASVVPYAEGQGSESKERLLMKKKKKKNYDLV